MAFVEFLNRPIEYVKGMGPKRAAAMKKELGITTFGELLTWYPFRYVDRSKFFLISDIDNDQVYVQLKGKITGLQIAGKPGSERLTANFRDNSGRIELIWFKGVKWLKNSLLINQEYVIFAKPAYFNGQFNIPHPEMELVAELKDYVPEPLQPFYSSTEKLKSLGLDSRGIRKVMRNLIAGIEGEVRENLTKDLVCRLKLPGREEALKNIHFPEDPVQLKRAQARIKFEELFYIQLRLLKNKFYRHHNQAGFAFTRVGEYVNRFYNEYLPFTLTNAQKKVIREIRADLGSGMQMNRLLQGDVGSGKTLVALMTMLIALDNGFQACLMAPTEILANQHFQNIHKMVTGLGVEVGLLTGSTKASARKKMMARLTSGELKIIIGTHALIEDKVQFNRLGLTVIDEQHRFGVMQRARMWSKSEMAPHILVMTATPIPRTLAMTLYGDLDISVIDELPPGRKPVQTMHFSDSQRLKVIAFIRKNIHAGRQVYIVFPLINESETLDLKYLMDGYDAVLRDFPYPDYAVSMVHGQLKTAEKEYEMERFVKGQTQIMVATTVIEVGVDVPNASLMVIENAERFGLSQLHQLRGRVGRGADQSYCILMTGLKVTTEARQRIETMVRTSDGFEVAEVDLRLRGPGDLEGTRQSGVIDLKLADIVKDEKILKVARQLAEEIIQQDPLLADPANQVFSRHILELEKEQGNLSRIS
ncbi:MAG: ATP-dependent DNA helicase RecG [Bacteroidetes bacterium]|nr:ATP-dependent DNA helicase RecG [Bacteroidota bacterium]